LWDRLIAVAGSPEVVAEVGRFAVGENLLGAVGAIVRLMGGVEPVLRRAETISGYFYSHLTLRPARIGQASALLEMTGLGHASGAAHAEQFTRGLLSGIPSLWDLPPSSVQVTGGADGPRFHVTWKRRRSRWRRFAWAADEDALAAAAAGLERDLREVEAMYARVQDASRELQQRVDERTAELARANRELTALTAKLEQTARLRGGFIADMSHEMRTLMTAISGFAELLASEILGSLNDRQRDACARISANSGVLLRSINDLLDLSQLHAGRMTVAWETVEVGALLREAIETTTPLAAAKGLDLTLAIAPETPPQVVTDPVKLKNALLNLLANAVKFTEQGGVELRAASAGPTAIVFSVEDTGSGLSDADIALLSEEFAQLGRGRSPQTHVGLGLHVTKKLVDLLHGGLAAGNRRGSGAVFTITLPLAPPAGEAAAAEAPPEWLAPGRNRRTVVVADSNAEDAHFLRLSLEAEGLRAEACLDGREVAHVVRQANADLLIIDPLLHHQDGWRILQELRAAPATAALPIIVVSENAQPDLARAVGAAETFGKPYDGQAVVRAALRLLGLARSGPETQTGLKQ
jgi:signal transduction histidine kinase/CheY-like chemotaxis protein